MKTLCQVNFGVDDEDVDEYDVVDDNDDNGDVVDRDDDVEDAVVLDGRPINCKVITSHSPGNLIAPYQPDHLINRG